MGNCQDDDWRIQSPFTGGVFCGNPDFVVTDPQQVAGAVGVQAQVFTIVNTDDDEYPEFSFPDLFYGMANDQSRGIGTHLTAYTGSTTGASFAHDLDPAETRPCDDISHISWQVDRVCHLVSAQSLDNYCKTMKEYPGYYRCGSDCSRPLSDNVKFLNGQNGAPMVPGFAAGETCCIVDARPEEARGIVDPALAANNHVDVNGNCDA